MTARYAARLRDRLRDWELTRESVPFGFGWPICVWAWVWVLMVVVTARVVDLQPVPGPVPGPADKPSGPHDLVRQAEAKSPSALTEGDGTKAQGAAHV